jgi:hypothetical protein
VGADVIVEKTVNQKLHFDCGIRYLSENFYLFILLCLLHVSITIFLC